MRSVIIALAAAAAMMATSPALACSFSWGSGQSPGEIRKRADVRKIEGVFRYGSGQGVLDEQGELYRGRITGRVEARTGRVWNTIQLFDQLLVECAAYHKPVADARGTFWISRHKSDGRYNMLLWEGEYLPRRNVETIQPDESE